MIPTLDQINGAFERFYLSHGFNKNQAKVLTTFASEEVAMFDDSLKELYTTSKIAERFRIDFYGHFHIPFEIAVELKEKIEPFKMQTLLMKQTLEGLTRKVKKSNEHSIQDARDLLEQQQSELREFEDIIRDTNRLPEYREFLTRLFNGILERVDRRISLEDHEMKNIGLRNQIYRNALGSDSWQLGYTLKLLGRMSAATAITNARRKEMYDSLPKTLRSRVDRETYVVFHPAPLGCDCENAGFVINKLLTQEDPAGYIAIAMAINKHFDKRLEQVLAE